MKITTRVRKKRKARNESHIRSILKGVTWRIVATLTTMILAFIFTGSVDTALKIGFFEVIAKIIFYYLHERAWLSIEWGRKANEMG